ncbi:NusG domain II-containing protein, partial [[Eubacterium] siraeum]|nr:NusG domain II-containing protein [[Eubacterium] siraeum]
SEQTFTVYSDDGGYNVNKVSGGAISVSDADCPDKICVKTAPVSDGIQPIVCMPHKLVIRVDARRGEYSYDS